MDELDDWINKTLGSRSRKPKAPPMAKDKIIAGLQRARAVGLDIPDDVVDDFHELTAHESGRSHYDAQGRVKRGVPTSNGERAIGFGQIMPSTARPYAAKGLDPEKEEDNIAMSLAEFYNGDPKDPVARRLAYVGGPKSKALRQYRRTGQVPDTKLYSYLPNNQETFQGYVKNSGGYKPVDNFIDNVLAEEKPRQGKPEDADAFIDKILGPLTPAPSPTFPGGPPIGGPAAPGIDPEAQQVAGAIQTLGGMTDTPAGRIVAGSTVEAIANQIPDPNAVQPGQPTQVPAGVPRYTPPAATGAPQAPLQRATAPVPPKPVQQTQEELQKEFDLWRGERLPSEDLIAQFNQKKQAEVETYNQWATEQAQAQKRWIPGEPLSRENVGKEPEIVAEEDAEPEYPRVTKTGAPQEPSDDMVLGVTATDLSASDEDRLRQAANKVLRKYDVTPEEIDKWIADSKAAGSPLLVGNTKSGNPNIQIRAQMLAQIKGADYARQAIKMEQAQARTEIDQGVPVEYDPVTVSEEEEAKKAALEGLDTPSFEDEAITFFTNLLTDPAKAGLYASQGKAGSPSDLAERQIRRQEGMEKTGFARAARDERYYQQMSHPEWASRVLANVGRGIVDTAVTGTLKGVDFLDTLVAKGLQVGSRGTAKNINDLKPIKAITDLFAHTLAAAQGKTFKGSDTSLLTALSKHIEDTMGEDKYLKDKFVGQFGKAVGSGLGFVLMGLVAPQSSLLKGRFSLTSAGLGGLTSAGSAYQEAKDKGLNENQALTSGALNGLLGLTEGFGVGAALNKALSGSAKREFLNGFLDWAKARGAAALKGSGEEALQEFIQSTGGKAVMDALQDKDPSAWQRVMNIVERLPGQAAETLVKEVPIAALTGGLFDAVGSMSNDEIEKAASDPTIQDDVRELLVAEAKKRGITILKPLVTEEAKAEPQAERVTGKHLGKQVEGVVIDKVGDTLKVQLDNGSIVPLKESKVSPVVAGPNLDELSNVVRDYKENPTVGDTAKVAKIKDYLTHTPQGRDAVRAVQDLLRQKHGDTLTVYRGGPVDFDTSSDAGWSTDIYTATEFAAQHGGEIAVAKVKVDDVLFSDEILQGHSNEFRNEGELIFKNAGDAKVDGYVDVGTLEENLDEDDRYTNTGYPSSQLEEQIAERLATIQNTPVVTPEAPTAAQEAPKATTEPSDLSKALTSPEENAKIVEAYKATLPPVESRTWRTPAEREQAGELYSMEDLEAEFATPMTEAPLGSASRRKQEETPEFKKFFGKSKVVDQGGKPKVVYRGGRGEESGGKFARGMHFFAESPQGAEVYATGKGANVQPVYLALQNPLDLSNVDLGDEVTKQEVEKLLGTPADLVVGDPKFGEDGHVWEYLDEDVRDFLIQQGYDGITTNEDGNAVYVAFEPSQIKSAIGNQGTFDPNEESILLSARTPNASEAHIQMQNLPFKDVLASGITAKQTGKGLEISSAAMDVLRRMEFVFGKRQAAVNDGAFMSPAVVQQRVQWLGNFIRKVGPQMTPKVLAEVKNLEKQLQRISKHGKIVYTFDDVVHHEKLHKMSFMGAEGRALSERHKDVGSLFAKTKTIVRKAFDAHYNPLGVVSEFENWDDPVSPRDIARINVLVEEIAISTMAGELDMIGLTPAEGAEFIKAWFDSYVATNGKQSLRIFDRFFSALEKADQTVLEAVQEKIYADQIDQAQEAQGLQTEEADTDAAGRQAESEEPGSDVPEGAEPAGQRAVEETGSPVGEERERATIRSAEAAGLIDADNVPHQIRYYNQKSKEPTTREAQDKIERIGLAAAILEAQKPAPTVGKMEHVALQQETVKLLNRQATGATALGQLDQAKAKLAQAQEIVSSAALQGTEMGQGISQLSEWQKTDPDAVTGLVQMKRAQIGWGKELSPEEQSAVRSDAEKFAELQATVDDLRSQIAKLEAQSKGETPAPRKREDKNPNIARLEKNKQAIIDRLTNNPLLSATKQGRLAPNGKPSNLSAEQWSQVRTPAFKAWFGDWEAAHNGKDGNGVWSVDDVSKVVDENGEPLVTYHGTTTGGFSKFDPKRGQKVPGTTWFTKDRDVARTYSGFGDVIQPAENDEDAKEQAGLYPVFLNIRNPYETNFEGANWDGSRDGQVQVQTIEDSDLQYNAEGRGYFFDRDEAQKLLDELVESGKFTEDELEIVDSFEHYETTDSAAREGLKYDHDGTIIRDVQDPGQFGDVWDPTDVFIAHEPTQIKSAVANKGTFDPTDESILGRASDQSPTSTVSLMQSKPEEAKAELGLKKGGNSVRESGEALDARTQKLGLAIDRDDRSVKQVNRIAQALAEEVRYQLGTVAATGSGLGWYSENFPKALRELTKIYPEFKDNATNGSMDLFTAILAITSNGEKVATNLQNAMAVYDQIRKGVSPTKINLGTARIEAFDSNMKSLEFLINKYGYKGMVKPLLEEKTVGELNKEMKALGQETVTGYSNEAILPAAVVHFGPKLGAFYANLMGSEGYLTMDLWWSRTFNRHRGLLIPFPTEQSIENLRKLLRAKGATDDEIVEMTPAIASRYSRRNHWVPLEIAMGRKWGKTNEEKAAFWKDAKASVVKPEFWKAAKARLAKELAAAEKVFQTEDAKLEAIKKKGLKKGDEAFDDQKKIREKAKNKFQQASIRQEAVLELKSHAFSELERGTMIEKKSNTIYKAAYKELEETPFGPGDRDFMMETAHRAQEMLATQGVHLSIADIQAALWYYEKRLYSHLGKTGAADDIGYEEAIQKAAKGGKSRRPTAFFDRQANARAKGQDTQSSKLDEEAPLGSASRQGPVDQIETPEFKNFFKDSKVVDESGKPLEVYHGTGQDVESFPKRSVGYRTAEGNAYKVETRVKFFADQPEVAGDFAEVGGRQLYSRPAGQPNIIPVYLSIQNPLDLSKGWTPEARQALSEAGVPRHVLSGMRPEDLQGAIDFDDVLEPLEAVGYDGAIFPDETGRGNTYAVFRPNQIKSSIGNRGTFDPSEESILGRASDPFFSQLERTVEQKMPKTASAEQVKGIIKDTKQEERDWLGIDQWLQDKEKAHLDNAVAKNHPVQGKLGEGFKPFVPAAIDKQELLDFIRANNVQVEEVEKGELPKPIAGSAWFEANASLNEYLDTNNIKVDRLSLTDSASRAMSYPLALSQARVKGDIEFDGELRSRYEALREAFKQRDAEARQIGTKFSQYTLPGGENYRELLLTLPDTRSAAWKIVSHNGKLALQKPDGNLHTDSAGNIATWSNRTAAEAALRSNNRSEGVYKSSHWNEPNVLAHVRFDDRTIDGKKTLHIAEIQSDWHQAGRKKGYVPTPEQRKAAKAEFAELQKQYPMESRPDEIGVKMADLLAVANNKGSGVPDAPFKKSWHEFAFKRMLRYAVDNGYDAISWDTGETQADRYDLSKQIDSISVDPQGGVNGVRSVNIKPKNESTVISFSVDDNGKVTDVEGGTSHHVETWEGKPISDVLGKDMAERVMGVSQDAPDTSELVASEHDGYYEVTTKSGVFITNVVGEADSAEQAVKIAQDRLKNKSSSINQRGIVTFTGLDLKTDSPGMKGFYDKILPSFVNKYTKKWGGRVESGALPSSDKDAVLVGAALGEEPEVNVNTPVHRLDITDSMRESVADGQPLYSVSPDEKKSRSEFLPLNEARKLARWWHGFVNEQGERFFAELVPTRDGRLTEVRISKVSPDESSALGSVSPDEKKLLTDYAAVRILEDKTHAEVIADLKTVAPRATADEIAEAHLNAWDMLYPHDSDATMSERAKIRLEHYREVQKTKRRQKAVAEAPFKEASKAARDSEKAAQAAADKAVKDAEKALEKATKDAEKAATKLERQAAKVAKAAALEAVRNAKKAQKEATAEAQKEATKRADERADKALREKFDVPLPDKINPRMLRLVEIGSSEGLGSHELHAAVLIEQGAVRDADEAAQALMDLYDLESGDALNAASLGAKFRKKANAQITEENRERQRKIDELKGKLPVETKKANVAQRQLLQRISALEKPPPSYSARLARVYKAALVSAVQTSVNNLLTAQGTRKVVALTDLVELVINKGLAKAGREMREDAIQPGVKFRDVLGIPTDTDNIAVAVYRSLSESVYAKGIAQAVLDEFPTFYEELFASYASDIEMLGDTGKKGPHELAMRGIEWTVDKANTLNKLQEFWVRSQEFTRALQIRLAGKGENLMDMINNDRVREIDPADLKHAVQEALRVTFALKPDPNTVGGKFILGYEQFMPSILAPLVLTFPRFMYNATAFISDYTPVIGLVKAGMKGKEVGGTYFQGFKNVNSRDVAKQLIGTSMFLAALSLVRALGDDDDWFLIRIPGNYVDGKPAHIDIRGYQPFAAFAFLASKVNRAINGKPIFSDPEKAFWETAEATIGLSRRSIAESKILQMGWAGLKVTGVVTGDEKEWDRLSYLAYQQLGEIAGGFMRPLKTVKDLVAQYDAWTGRNKENAIPDLIDRPGMQGIARSLPFANEILGAESRKDFVTGKTAYQYGPGLKVLGVTVANPDYLEAIPSQALAKIRTLDKKHSIYDVLPEKQRERAVKSSLWRAVREAGDDIEKQKLVIDAFKRAEETGALKKGSIDYIERGLGRTELESRLKNTEWKNVIQVLKVATPAEVEEVRPALVERLNGKRTTKPNEDQAKELLDGWGIKGTAPAGLPKLKKLKGLKSLEE